MKDILNFGSGLILGAIGVAMWYYSKFLYYSVFTVQTIIIFILINYKATADNNDLTKSKKTVVKS